MGCYVWRNIGQSRAAPHLISSNSGNQGDELTRFDLLKMGKSRAERKYEFHQNWVGWGGSLGLGGMGAETKRGCYV